MNQPRSLPPVANGKNGAAAHPVPDGTHKAAAHPVPDGTHNAAAHPVPDGTHNAAAHPVPDGTRNAAAHPVPDGTRPYRTEELLITVIAKLLQGCGHIAVGVSSPIPGAASLLCREWAASDRSVANVKVSIIGSDNPEFRTDGGVGLFDCAGQGRVDAFFLSGGQIDGAANINLVGIGDYPQQKVRWSGSFGSAYLYYVVPRVILFREEHSRRTLVEQVDFISAPGSSPANVHRPGGPYALVTSLCVFLFDKPNKRFRLASLHPGVSLEQVRDLTGFEFDCSLPTPQTAQPDAAELSLLRQTIAPLIADPYPKFAERVFGIDR